MDPGEGNPAVPSIGAAICPDRNGTSGMSGIKKRAKRLACRLGLDANPLRRRTDKIATCLAAQLLLVCLVGAPLLGMAAFGWVARAGAAEQRAERSWSDVPAVLPGSAAVPHSFATGLVCHP